jgi:hypothetical protein
MALPFCGIRTFAEWQSGFEPRVPQSRRLKASRDLREGGWGPLAWRPPCSRWGEGSGRTPSFNCTLTSALQIRKISPRLCILWKAVRNRLPSKPNIAEIIVLFLRLNISISWLSDRIILVWCILYASVRKGGIDEKTLWNPAALYLSCAKTSISLEMTSHLLPLLYGTRDFHNVTNLHVRPTAHDNFCGMTFKMSNLITPSSTSLFHVKLFLCACKPCYT